MANIVLVPGGYHGGWYFSPIIPDIRAAGHTVHAISLSGLGGSRERSQGDINLDTHIEDVVSLIEDEQLEDVVLCGHSYAGLVIAGAADRLRGHIRSLLFIDALVPKDGESVWSTWGPPQREHFAANSPDGIVTSPPPGLDPRTRAHPLACFLQPVRLSEDDYGAQDKTFVWCRAWADGPYKAIHQRVVDQGGWTIYRVPFGHDIVGEAPETARDLILAVAERRTFVEPT
jgi:pimeloyl-ACP methyl ester carboxylesterase